MAERDAYTRWVPALRPRAPRLLSFDDGLQLLVLSALPGLRPEDWTAPDLQHQAGRLLRALHDAEDLGSWDDMVAAKCSKLDYWAARGRGLVEARLVRGVRARLAPLDGIKAQRVPCHADFSPRNWLVADGHLGVIDFGDARGDVWVHDFGRLLLGWRLGGDGRAALFDGYGRTPTVEDLELLRASYAVDLVWGIVWADEHDNTEFALNLRSLLESILEDDIF